ncbi:MAG: rod shape-determining protein RodA [Actinomycetota bacterium]
MELTAGRLIRDERVIRHLDPVLIVTGVALAVYGIFMVYSATRLGLEALGEDPGFFLKRQSAFLLLGMVALLVAASVDYRLVKVYAPLAWAGAIFVLLLVLTPLGSETAGAQRWITLGGFQFQPSEFAKLAVTAMISAYLSELRGDMGIEQVWRTTGLAVLPMLLVFVQPDVGTTMVFAAILVALLVMGGAKAKFIGVLALVAVIALFGAFRLGVVKDYQIQRLTGFIDPTEDPLRAGYNRQQAEIAIGSGGLFGLGYLQGTQTNLDFVPEQHTDFVFTVVGEELGFVGGMFLLLLFGVLLWRAFRIAAMATDPFGRYLAVGIAVMIAFQLFVNVGMTLGIMPITGIPLPLVSYGGSALVTNLTAVGLLLNVHMRRFK